jgi:hypothetical protein
LLSTAVTNTRVEMGGSSLDRGDVKFELDDMEC